MRPRWPTPWSRRTADGAADVDLFAGIGVRDYARGVEWVSRLLGRPPAFDAHETECVFEVAEHRYLYVALEP